MKLYRQVSTSERMPENDGWYFTDNAKVEFIKEKGYFTYNGIKSHAWWWLQEIEIPNEEAVTDYANNEMLFNGIEFSNGFTKGYNFLLKRLKG